MWSKCLTNILRLVSILSIVYFISAAYCRPQICHLPPQNPHFVGRQDILKAIAEMFKNTALKTTVISGPQGFGKTQIAKRFAYNNLEKYDVIWWFRANQYMKPQFEKFTAAMAGYLKVPYEEQKLSASIERVARAVKTGIQKHHLKCLIIFDDAQAYREIEDYFIFSQDKNIDTLITTKNGNFSSKALRITAFNRRDSITCIDLFLPDESLESKTQLAQRMTDCPVALAVAIEYIKSYPGMSIDQYLQKHAALKFSPPLQDHSRKLESSVDDYETDLYAAIQLNIEHLRHDSEEAYQLLGLLAILHRDEIPINFVEDWATHKKIKTDITKLIALINQYSLIEASTPSKAKGATITMQELVQSTVTSLIPLSEKQKMVEDAVEILKPSFARSSDKNVETILKDIKPLLSAHRVSQEAYEISFCSSDLTHVRIRAFDVLAGMIRDFSMTREIISHLKRDLEQSVSISKIDQILYYANMALYAALDSPDYDNAISYGLKALAMTEGEPDFVEERIRIISNLIQAHALSGRAEGCQQYVDMGDEIFTVSKSDAYNAFFILAKNVYLLDKAAFREIITLVDKNVVLLDRQTFYPSMRYFILLQKSEALLKKGDRAEAEKVLCEAEEYARDYHKENKQNLFFGKFYILKSLCLPRTKKAFAETQALLEKGIIILNNLFNGTDKHRLQAYGHLEIAKLYHHNKKYEEAKTHYHKSEEIFDKLLKNKKVDDISDLYAMIAILGVDMKEESVILAYLNKHKSLFGLAHPRTKDIVLYMDKNKVVLPV